MGEGVVVDHGHAADVHLSLGGVFAKPLDEIGPYDVRVGLCEDIPVHIWALLPSALDHVEKLVLVQVPGAAHVLGARLLGDGAFGLGIVEVELLVGLLDGLVDAVEDIFEMILANLLFLEARWSVSNHRVYGAKTTMKDGKHTRSEKMRKSGRHCMLVSRCVGIFEKLSVAPVFMTSRIPSVSGNPSQGVLKLY